MVTAVRLSRLCGLRGNGRSDLVLTTLPNLLIRVPRLSIEMLELLAMRLCLPVCLSVDLKVLVLTRSIAPLNTRTRWWHEL